jgi:hypothetical protein
MADAGKDSPLVARPKLLRLVIRRLLRLHAIVRSVKHETWNMNHGLGREPPFQFFERRISGDISVAVPVGMDGHVHKIRIIKGPERRGEKGLIPKARWATKTATAAG